MENFVKQQQQLLERIENNLKGGVVFFEGQISPITAVLLHKILRKMDKSEKLFLILESTGGNIDSAAKIVHMCKEYFPEVNVVVPFYAKSAASLIAIAADNLYLGKGGEIGPIDPQVKHPSQGYYFPALSIKEAIAVVEETKDPYIKMGLTERLDPYLIGAYRRMLGEATQYIERAKLVEESKNKDEILNELSQKYISHGYPIDRKECKRMGLRISDFDEDTNNLLYELAEGYICSLVDNEELQSDLFIITKKLSEVKVNKNSQKENPVKSEPHQSKTKTKQHKK